MLRSFSVAARERHDLVRAQAGVRAAEQSFEPASLGCWPTRNEKGSALGVKFEFDLASGGETEAVPNIFRDRDLPLAGDPRRDSSSE